MNPWDLGLGDEQFRQFYSFKLERNTMQYDYKDHDGQLFQTVCDDLEEARQRRDEWLKEKEKEKIK